MGPKMNATLFHIANSIDFVPYSASFHVKDSMSCNRMAAFICCIRHSHSVRQVIIQMPLLSMSCTDSGRMIGNIYEMYTGNCKRNIDNNWERPHTNRRNNSIKYY